MRIKDVMTVEPTVCPPATSVAEAAHLMWDADCGILPVVDGGALVGVVTDRDLFIALATRNAVAATLTVSEVATTGVWTCGPDDEVQTALETMKARRVRRLPVVGADATVVGIVSMNDILLAAGSRKRAADDDIVSTLRSICARDPRPQTVAA